MQYHSRTASCLLQCEYYKDENWLYRPSVSETAGARYEEWLAWHGRDKDCLLSKTDCQFWWRLNVERGWTTPVDEVTL